MVDKRALQKLMDRRQQRRFETSWPGWLLVKGQAESCHVVDISSGGVKVRRSSKKPLPAKFKLVIQEPRFTADCELCHAAQSFAGLRFVETVALPVVPETAEAA